MHEQGHPTDTAAEALHRLADLRFERAIAGPSGLLDDPEYLADLDDDIAASVEQYVGLAVTEIASLRAALDGPLLG